jgi:hypothetical protein
MTATAPSFAFSIWTDGRVKQWIPEQQKVMNQSLTFLKVFLLEYWSDGVLEY